MTKPAPYLLVDGLSLILSTVQKTFRDINKVSLVTLLPTMLHLAATCSRRKKSGNYYMILGSLQAAQRHTVMADLICFVTRVWECLHRSAHIY